MKCPECKGEFYEKESVIINRDPQFSWCDDCFFNVAIEGADYDFVTPDKTPGKVTLIEE